MEPTRELIDEMFRDRVRRAREMPPEEKLLAGPRLFDLSCRIMADGIRNEFPDADEGRVQEIVRERLALARRLEQSP
jgi:hypothetical protein